MPRIDLIAETSSFSVTTSEKTLKIFNLLWFVFNALIHVLINQEKGFLLETRFGAISTAAL